MDSRTALPPDRLAYTPAEFGAAIGLDPVTVRRLITSGRLRAVNVSARGGRPAWRIPADAVDEFLRR